MTDISITLANGRSFTFDVSERGTQPPCFLLSMRKCGSTLINHICAVLAEANGRHFVNVGHIFFSANLLVEEWVQDPAMRQIVRPNTIYGGFRNMPEFAQDDPVFLAAPKLLMIRDPRDALVSEYFSNAFSHPIPSKTDGEDAVVKMMEKERARALTETIQSVVVRRARPMGRDYLLYAPLMSMPNLLVLKYEDVILHKREMIARLAAHFGMQVSEAKMAEILAWADVQPEDEDPHRFVRQVMPGDHRRKLEPATIEALNKSLERPMEMFGYTP